MDLRQTECKYVYWTHLAQDRYQLMGLVCMVMNFGIHKTQKVS